MSEEIYCAKCNNLTEEILLLSCDHNLCIPCAAENISKQESRGVNKTQLVICDLCKCQTEISNETSKEILSIAMNGNRTMNNGNPNPAMNNSGVLNMSNQNYYSNNDMNLNMSNTMSKYNMSFYPGPSSQKEICQEHGEVISYLCFDCLSKCICSECVVHGIHRNHEVINIKKAYPLICEKAEELVSHVEDKIKDLNSADNTLQIKCGELTGLTEKCKREIKVAFEEIRIKLNKKEKEIIDKTESILQDNMQELNTYSRIIQSKIIGLNKIVDSVKSHLMRKDELTLINFYCENKNKILNSSQVTELQNMPDLNTISNLRIDIDKSAFDTMINALNALHFEITSMKGIDVNSRINTQKYTVRRNLYGTPLPIKPLGGISNSEELGNSGVLGGSSSGFNEVFGKK